MTSLRTLARCGLVLAAALYATILVSPAPWAGPAVPACTPLAAFMTDQVEPVRRAGLPIVMFSDRFEVARYLAVVNAEPPQSDIKGDGPIIGVANHVAVVAVVQGGQVCMVLQIGLGLHESALLAAQRGV